MRYSIVITIFFGALCIPIAHACNTAADCRVEGQFNRAMSMDLQRSYSTTPSNSSGNSSSNALSTALANSFKQWEASKNAESKAADARYNAWAEAARKRPITRFTDTEIANAERNILIFGAEEGRAKRQNQLGLALLEGSSGFTVDTEQGLHWLKKAAEQGDHNALMNLAIILTEGSYGIKSDPMLGLKMFELYINASKLSDIEKATFLMDKSVEIYKADDTFLPQAMNAALNAYSLGVDYAPSVIFKLVLVNPPTNPKLKEVLDNSRNPFIVAAKGLAITHGLAGFTQDKSKGQEIIQAEAALNRQPSIDYVNFLNCSKKYEKPEEIESKCFSLSKFMML